MTHKHEQTSLLHRLKLRRQKISIEADSSNQWAFEGLMRIQCMHFERSCWKDEYRARSCVCSCLLTKYHYKFKYLGVEIIKQILVLH